jgi:hypothetical protein
VYVIYSFCTETWCRSSVFRRVETLYDVFVSSVGQSGTVSDRGRHCVFGWLAGRQAGRQAHPVISTWSTVSCLLLQDPGYIINHRVILRYRLLHFSVNDSDFWPVPMAAQSKVHTVFNRSNTGIVGLNPARVMHVCTRFSVLCCLV